eukprot:1009832-Pyramimonas_sp.AAC.1
MGVVATLVPCCDCRGGRDGAREAMSSSVTLSNSESRSDSYWSPQNSRFSRIFSRRMRSASAAASS